MACEGCKETEPDSMVTTAHGEYCLCEACADSLFVSLMLERMPHLQGGSYADAGFDR